MLELVAVAVKDGSPNGGHYTVARVFVDPKTGARSVVVQNDDREEAPKFKVGQKALLFDDDRFPVLMQYKRTGEVIVRFRSLGLHCE